ncbi:hypothetical protein [Streptomyces syringium]|uniref:Uncharacterized protein n=1 Tax=Streptomyces syringium TaxID=76729 RepID=A0ABS4Y5V9_9ACTN|nr:hypothetical protein [Streptomyces syringium]MBP2404162.1 hypothetical protein [Streptomyces syringium]
MRKTDTAKLAAAQGAGPNSATTRRPTRELPRTGRRTVVRTQHQAPRRTY